MTELNKPAPKEFSEKPKYEHFASNVRKNPWDQSYVFYRAAEAIGYPLEFVLRGARYIPDEDTSDPDVGVMVKDQETNDRLNGLLREIVRFNTDALLYSVSQGRPFEVLWLLQEDNESFYKKHPNVDIKRRLDRRVLEECFMRAFERNREYADIATKDGWGFLTDDVREIEPIYRELKEIGVRPLTSEAMQLMTAQDMNEIIADHPELAP